MLSDIEIAKQAKMLKIGEVAAKLGISEDEYEPYGHYKAKLSESLYAKTKNDPDGKLILVTAINPTPAGEGKTTISVGLAESMNKIGKKAIVAFIWLDNNLHSSQEVEEKVKHLLQLTTERLG